MAQQQAAAPVVLSCRPCSVSGPPPQGLALGVIPVRITTLYPQSDRAAASRLKMSISGRTRSGVVPELRADVALCGGSRHGLDIGWVSRRAAPLRGQGVTLSFEGVCFNLGARLSLCRLKGSASLSVESAV
jgi:hypothetical protein